MSLQMMIGGEGSHRSEYMYKKLIEESMAHPEQNFYLVVPEQYTMQTQMKMTELHPGHGVMNIDIVSFLKLICPLSETIQEIFCLNIRAFHLNLIPWPFVTALQ